MWLLHVESETASKRLKNRDNQGRSIECSQLTSKNMLFNTFVRRITETEGILGAGVEMETKNRTDL